MGETMLATGTGERGLSTEGRERQKKPRTKRRQAPEPALVVLGEARVPVR